MADNITPRELWCSALMDTGADVSCLPHGMWPDSWPTVQSRLEGLGGNSLSEHSLLACWVSAQDSDGSVLVANVRPHKAQVSEPLLGRDVLQQWGVRLSNF